MRALQSAINKYNVLLVEMGSGALVGDLALRVVSMTPKKFILQTATVDTLR